MTVDLDHALTDRNLLGAALGDAAPWQIWRIVLRAAFGLKLTREEARTFAAVAGGRKLPSQRVRELWAVVARRSGKSRMAAALAVYAACFMPHKLSRGETGYVLVLAASRHQARVVFDYVKGFLEASPVLKQEVASVTASEIRLKSGVIIAIHANSFRSIRGRTLLAVILDEIALWRDENSATPDVEVYRAVLPALMTTNGMLIGISTPYRKVGLLYQKHRDHFGQDNNDVLVVQGASTTFNPTLIAENIAAAIADDPESARAEWEGEWRTDIAAFLDDHTIESVTDHGRPLELPPSADHRYFAFADPSGGRHDSYCIAIAHREKERTVVDCVRGTRPPFDPHEVTKDFAALCREYRVTKVVGDRYSAEWVVRAFKDAGLAYKPSEKSKSDLYLESLPLFTRGIISIPDLAPLLRELRMLERQTHRGGRDSIDHPRGGSDDWANALAGAALLARKPRYSFGGSWVAGTHYDDDDEEPQEQPKTAHHSLGIPMIVR